MQRTAMCACGELQITVVGDPDRVLACNCRPCQRRTGSAFGIAAYFPDAQVTRIEGQAHTFSRTTGAHTFLTSFCPNCGTSVFWRASALREQIAIAVGCFADPSFPPPTIVAWTSEQHEWVSFPEGGIRTSKSAFD
jgi:hypothetical protein